MAIICLPLLCSGIARGQFLMDMIDTTTSVGKGMFSLYQKYDAVRFSGYIQPQFQYATHKGIDSYAGGNFPDEVDNRFSLRRGRFRLDYARYNDDHMPMVQFAFQFDGTERGVFIRDFFGRIFENKWDVFSLTAGMFARPISYEVNLSSGDRETPERGRMSQILMRTERDIGAMVSFEPRRPDHPLKFMKIDVGLFNGQGLTATSDFDSHKDIITRWAIKPIKLNSRNWRLSAAVSMLYGGMEQFTRNIYRTGTQAGKPAYYVDSTVTNMGKIAPRHYYGADLQLRIPNGKGKGATEFRMEYLRGTQTATAATSETPGTIPVSGGVNAPLYIRKFDGAYLYYMQNLGNPRDLIVIKYDWYDPNKQAKGKEIGATGSGMSAADIRYNTLGMGYVHYFNPNMKVMLYYDIVKNEETSLQEYTEDLPDNVFTCRLQYRF